MIKTIRMEKTEEQLWQDCGVAFARVPGWCGHTSRDLKLSVVRPASAGPFPAILWLCGGAWLSMDAEAHLPNFTEIVRRGYVVASAEYRCSNEASFPAQLEDVKAAIRFLRANAAEWGIDPERIGIMGESAGGHLAALAGTTSGLACFDRGAHLDKSSAVQAVCAWYPVTDLSPVRFDDVAQDPFHGLSPENQFLGGTPEGAPGMIAKANPIAYIGEGTPPFLIFHGTADTLVPSRHSRELHAALEAQGIPAELYLVEGAGHASVEFFQSGIRDIILDFFGRSLA